MHEYSIVSALIDRVEVEARARGATRVHSVHLRIGDLAGVDRQLLARAFETFRDRSVCQSAELRIRAVEARWVCSRCGVAVPPGAILRCPACDLPARLDSGDEILLDRIEMEVA